MPGSDLMLYTYLPDPSPRLLLACRLSSSPDCVDSLVCLARLLWEAEDREASVPLFLRAARVCPSLATPFLYLAHHYSGLGEAAREKARKCYARLLYPVLHMFSILAVV